MEQCSECGKGYCASRVRKVFGQLPRGVCSATCYTKRATLAYSKRKETSMEIIDALYLGNFIAADIVEDDDKFAEMVKLIQPYAKENGA